MTLAITLLFALNLYRQLSHKEAQKPQEAQKDFGVKPNHFLMPFARFVPLVAIRLTAIAKIS
jgi:hypothetical protein